MKKSIFTIFLLILLTTVGCTPVYVNTEDDVVDIHEKDIKDMLLSFGYTEDKVKDIEIVYIGEVNDYLFYKVNESNQIDGIGFVAGTDEIAFPPGTNKTYFVFDKQDKLHYPLQGVLNNPILSDYIQEVSDLINENSI